MLEVRRDRACCDRWAGGSVAVRTARRRLLKAAVFGTPQIADHGGAGAGRSGAAGDGFPGLEEFPRAVTGTIRDVSPHVLVMASGSCEMRYTLTAETTAWHGGQLEPAALRPDDQAVVRLLPGQRRVADRIWAGIGRVTGTIVSRGSDGLLVAEGATRKRQVVRIPPQTAGKIQVRFPILEPGYLIDVIGLRKPDGCLEARLPATSQPAYRADRIPAQAPAGGHPWQAISGSATWHESSGEPPGLLGVAYPAIDPQAGCAEQPSGGQAVPGLVRMPYLAVGSVLRVRNDCTGSSCLLPVTGCAGSARLFNDRCVTCGTSPRGRVADLTVASFVALGGELDRACFNATITIGR